MSEKTKLLEDVTLTVSPTFKSASWLASGTGQRNSTTGESRRYKNPAFSVKDFCSACDYIRVPINAATELIHLEAVHLLNRLPVQRPALALECRSNTADAAPNPKRRGASLPPHSKALARSRTSHSQMATSKVRQVLECAAGAQRRRRFRPGMLQRGSAQPNFLHPHQAVPNDPHLRCGSGLRLQCRTQPRKMSEPTRNNYENQYDV